MTPQSLEEIYAKLAAKNIGGKKGVSNKLIPGVGPVPCNLMFIGEAPGADEDESGIPFVGDAGRVFDDLLGLLPVNREDVFLTNTFKYRPPNNRDPLYEEIVESIDCISEEIKLVNPKVIVPLGKVAISIFFPGSSISEVRGKMHPASTPGRYIFPTYHPALVLYSNNDGAEKIRSDFRKLRNLLPGI